MIHRIEEYFQRIWYGGVKPPLLLTPFEKIYQHVVSKKRQQFLRSRESVFVPDAPVIVVGNITVGGTGKTPLTIFLIDAFKARGLRVGVISRGYGGKAMSYPVAVDTAASACEVGDEPLMVHLRTGVPVVVDPNRVAAAKYLEEHYAIDIIISDDGLQHYALNRSVEIVVMDATRGAGNERCLPSGPLREPIERLTAVDYLVVNGGGVDSLSESVRQVIGNESACYDMQIQPQQLVPLSRPHHSEAAGGNTVDGTSVPEEIGRKKVYAVAGIGNPKRFFGTLRQLGYEVIEKPFPDHHQYQERDFAMMTQNPIIMTEKDAVKVWSLNLASGKRSVEGWYLKVSASINPTLIDDILYQLFPKEKMFE